MKRVLAIILILSSIALFWFFIVDLNQASHPMKPQPYETKKKPVISPGGNGDSTTVQSGVHKSSGGNSVVSIKTACAVSSPQEFVALLKSLPEGRTSDADAQRRANIIESYIDELRSKEDSLIKLGTFMRDKANWDEKTIGVILSVLGSVPGNESIQILTDLLPMARGYAKLIVAEQLLRNGEYTPVDAARIRSRDSFYYALPFGSPSENCSEDIVRLILDEWQHCKYDRGTDGPNNFRACYEAIAPYLVRSYLLQDRAFGELYPTLITQEKDSFLKSFGVSLRREADKLEEKMLAEADARVREQNEKILAIQISLKRATENSSSEDIERHLSELARAEQDLSEMINSNSVSSRDNKLLSIQKLVSVKSLDIIVNERENLEGLAAVNKEMAELGYVPEELMSKNIGMVVQLASGKGEQEVTSYLRQFVPISFIKGRVKDDLLNTAVNDKDKFVRIAAAKHLLATHDPGSRSVLASTSKDEEVLDQIMKSMQQDSDTQRQKEKNKFSPKPK